MANFSGAIKIGDVNDFIAPSDACVLNFDGSLDAKSKVTIPPVPAEKPEIKGFRQTTTDETTNAIKVSLQDCLACSGCVTTAETMLLQHQSTDELLSKLEDASVTVVASVSHQSIASLAAHYDLPMHACAQRLASFLKGLGVSTVLSLQTARSLALAETASDFTQRYRACFPAVPSQLHSSPTPLASQPDNAAPPVALQPQPQASPPGFPWQLPPNAAADIKGATCQGQSEPALATAAQACCRTSHEPHIKLPMLVSACPGWVCYAEKTHGEWILPYLSTAKSPQAMAGSLVKGTLSSTTPPHQAPSAADAAHCGCGVPTSGPNEQLQNGTAAGTAVDGGQGVCCKSGADSDTEAQAVGGGRAVEGAAELAAARRSVYHVSIMPCYDKKLEAARGDFAIPAGGRPAAVAPGGDGAAQPWGASAADAVPETDSVLTTSEVQELLEARGVRLSEAACGAAPLDDWRPFVAGVAAASEATGAGVCEREGCAEARGSAPGVCCGGDEEAGPAAMDVDAPTAGGCGKEACCRTGSRQGAAGGQEWRLPSVRGGSGGYLEFALKHAAWALYGQDLGEAPLEMKVVRSKDFQEVAVLRGGRCVLRGAQAYGFRSIQNLVRKIRSGRCPYDIVEVMACPSGCLNGGGQIKVAGGHSALQGHLGRLHTLYHDDAGTRVQWPAQDGTAGAARQGALPAALRTEFHRREKNVQAALVDW